MHRICVFCGSSEGRRPAYAAAARTMGEAIARRGLGLVYGGGRVGLMGALADAALAARGEVVGIIPQALARKEVAHTGLTELRVVRSMHERKAAMADLADGFAMLPGGFGTFEEFCEIVTWAQLGLHRKPCALLNVDGYFRPLIAMFDRATEEGFVRPAHRALVLTAADPDALLDQMAGWQAPAAARRDKWLSEGEE